MPLAEVSAVKPNQRSGPKDKFLSPASCRFSANVLAASLPGPSVWQWRQDRATRAEHLSLSPDVIVLVRVRPLVPANRPALRWRRSTLRQKHFAVVMSNPIVASLQCDVDPHNPPQG